MRLKLHYGDLTDASKLIRIIQQVKPDEIYNLAAQSHVVVSFETREYTANADAIGTLRLLGAIRILGLEKRTRFYQASTSEMFGKVQSIQGNVIDSGYHADVEKLVFLGSSCFYPRLAPQPIKEEYLLTGPLEPSNQWYAVAKIAGIKRCQLTGANSASTPFAPCQPISTPGNDFDLESSHVLPALIRRFHEAEMRGDAVVTAWGSGRPRREFLHVSDLADAIVLLLERYDEESIINVGCGADVSIRNCVRS